MKYSTSEVDRIGRAYLERFGPVPAQVGRVVANYGLRDRKQDALLNALKTGEPVDWSHFDLSLPESSER